MKNNKFSLTKTSIVVVTVSLVVKLVSYIKDILIATTFGASVSSDVFIQSITITNLFVTIIVTPFCTAYTPFASEMSVNIDDRSRKFCGRIYINIICITLIECMLFLFFSETWVSILAPGFDGAAKEMLLSVLLLTAPLIIIQSLYNIGNVNLKALGKFANAEMLVIVPYIAEVLYILSAQNISVNRLAISYVMGFIVAIIVQYIPIYKRLKPQFTIHLLDKNIKKIYVATAALLLSSVVRQINTSVNSMVASLLPTGSVTIVSYASKIAITEFQIISSSISAIILVKMAQNTASGREKENKSLFMDAFNMANTFILPMALLTALLSNEIITILFNYGSFTHENVVDTAATMRVYTIGMVAHGMQDILVLSMYSYKKTKYAITSSLVLVVTNIILNVLLYKPLGTTGIAIAEAISVTIIIPYLLFVYKKKIINYSFSSLLCDFMKVVVSTVSTGAFVYIVKHLLEKHDASAVMVIVVVGIISIAIYFLFSVLLKNRFFVNIFNNLRTRHKGTN